MPRRKTTRGKHASILDFLSISSSNKRVDENKKNNKEKTSQYRSFDKSNVEERVVGNKEVEHLEKNEGEKSVSENNVEEDLSDLLSIIGRRKTTITQEIEPEISAKEQTPISGIINENNDLLNKSIMELDVGKLELPTGEILDKILWDGLGKDNVVCDSTGKCTDGISVGEIYTDQFGFRRQRGYVNTTRLPVYTDWIVEEGLVKKILPRAYGLKTNRGAIALIPEDFLCELQARYGVILLNYDKCSKYRSVLGYAQSKPTRRSRRKK